MDNPKLKPIIEELKSSNRLHLIQNVLLAILKVNKICIENPSSLEEFLLYMVQWSDETQQNILRQKLSFILARIYILNGSPKRVFPLLEPLIKYFKSKDNKFALLTTNMLNSKASLMTDNLSAARSWLTSARALATMIFVDKEKNMELDYLSGLVYLKGIELGIAAGYFADCFGGINRNDNKGKIYLGNKENSSSNLFDSISKFSENKENGNRKKGLKEKDFFRDTEIKVKAIKLYLLCKALEGKISEGRKMLEKHFKGFSSNSEIVSLLNLGESVLKNDLSAYVKYIEEKEIQINNERRITNLNSKNFEEEKNEFKMEKSHLKSSDLFGSLLGLNVVKVFYRKILDKRLLELTSFYTRVQLAHLAEKVGVNVDIVEERLFWFIVNEKVDGKIKLDEIKGKYLDCRKDGNKDKELFGFLEESCLALEYLEHLVDLKKRELDNAVNSINK